ACSFSLVTICWAWVSCSGVRVVGMGILPGERVDRCYSERRQIVQKLHQLWSCLPPRSEEPVFYLIPRFLFCVGCASSLRFNPTLFVKRLLASLVSGEILCRDFLGKPVWVDC